MLNEDMIENEINTVNKATHYEILDIKLNATEKEIGVAFKKLSLKNHPDRNPNDSVAEKLYNQVGTAYNILIDPAKRSEYDLSIKTTTDEVDKNEEEEPSTVDIKSLGGVGRAFGAFVSRLGVSFPTQIPTEILKDAQEICKNEGIKGQSPPVDSRVTDLVWGWGIDCRVERQNAVYYRLNVDDKACENGYLIICKSIPKDKFKIIIFNSDGVIVHEESSAMSQNKSNTESILYFTKFNTFQHIETPPNGDKETPSLFTKLENFKSSSKEINAGQYLVCVYGDNFIGKSSINIVAVPSKNDAPEVASICMNDAAVIDVQKELSVLNIEYTNAKTAYELTLSKIKSTNEKVDTLLKERADSYRGFIGASIKEYLPEDPTHSESIKETSGIQQQASATVANVQAQASVAVQNASNAVGNVSSAVANSAKSATESIGRRLSIGTKFGMGFLQKARASFSQESPDKEEEKIVDSTIIDTNDISIKENQDETTQIEACEP